MPPQFCQSPRQHWRPIGQTIQPFPHWKMNSLPPHPDNSSKLQRSPWLIVQCSTTTQNLGRGSCQPPTRPLCRNDRNGSFRLVALECDQQGASQVSKSQIGSMTISLSSSSRSSDRPKSFTLPTPKSSCSLQLHSNRALWGKPFPSEQL